MQVSAGAQRPEDDPGGLTPTHRAQSVPPHKNNLWKTTASSSKLRVPFLSIPPPPGSTLLLSPPVVLQSFSPDWGTASAARPKECCKINCSSVWLTSSTLCLRHGETWRHACVWDSQDTGSIHWEPTVHRLFSTVGSENAVKKTSKWRKKSLFLDV